MTLRAWGVLALTWGLTACASPETACQRAASADLRAHDANIAAAERDLARGYQVIPEQLPETRLYLCNWPKEPVLFCTETIRKAAAEQRVPLDTASAARDLDALRAQRATLAAQAASAQAQCR